MSSPSLSAKEAMVKAMDPKVIVDATKAALEAITGPNGPCPITRQTVNGVSYLAFANPPRTLPEWYERQFKQFSNEEWIVFRDERYTFKQANEQIGALAHQLVHKFGVKPGDRCSIAMRNNPEWCFSFVAITAIGAVVVPLNSWWKGNELHYGLEHSDTVLLICDDFTLERAGKSIQQLKIKTIAVRSKKSIPGVHHYADVIEGAKGRPVPYATVDTDELACLMYTSGTTGKPKGAMQSHRGLTTQAQMLDVITHLTTFLKLPPPANPPCVIIPVPLFHVTGCVHVFLASLGKGGKLVIMEKWNPGEALRLIQKERPTSWTGVPTMVQDLMEHPDFAKYDTSSLIDVAGGGAATPPAQVERTFKAFPNALPSQGYGLTETTGGFVGNKGVTYIFKPKSTGLPMPVAEVQVIDEETGKPVGFGKRGELVVKSPLVMLGYWKNPEATAATMTTINGDAGWFKTGDIVVIEEDGYIYIVDRAKEIIIRGGENISCNEVEAAFYTNPAVMECTVYGLPDSRLGEVVGITVHLKPGAKATAEELIDSVKSQLAHFKVPLAANLRFSKDSLPRGDTGKILKRAVKEEVLKEMQSKKSKL